MDLFFAVISMAPKIVEVIGDVCCSSDNSKKSVIASAFADNTAFDTEHKALRKKLEKEAEEYYKREYIDRGRKDTLISETKYDRDFNGRVISKKTYRVDYKK